MAAPKGLLIVPIGFRADGTLRTLELTDDDELKVAIIDPDLSGLLGELEDKLETADLELVSKILSIGSHGWYGSAWRRNPLTLGFSATKAQIASLPIPSDGDHLLQGAQCGAGEIWIVKYAGVYYSGTPPSKLRILPIIDGVQFDVLTETTVVSGIWYTAALDVVLGQDDRMQAYAIGATEDDTFLLRWYGIRIDIDQ